MAEDSSLEGILAEIRAKRAGPSSAEGLFICRVLHKRQLPELHPIDDDE